ncbi:MAG TPA: hypothetical protein VK801_15450 [Caulobacteraceae bacterium]|nr:hypothetical protein [Caulobacteraceae bacterium]
MASARVVLGFRPHTYWTAVVAVAGEVGQPEVIRRARLEFAEGDTRLVYHRAATMAPDAAARWVETVRSRTREAAGLALAPLLQDMATEGYAVARAVVPRGGGRVPNRLDEIVRSHSAQHAAEGEFYRDVVADACGDAGLAVTRLVERELHALAADLLGERVEVVKERLQTLGRTLGPPWSEDQRLAMLAAWVGLAGEKGVSAAPMAADPI